MHGPYLGCIFGVEDGNSPLVFLVFRWNSWTILFLDSSMHGTVSISVTHTIQLQVNDPHPPSPSPVAFCPIPTLMDYFRSNYDYWKSRCPDSPNYSEEEADVVSWSWSWHIYKPVMWLVPWLQFLRIMWLAPHYVSWPTDLSRDWSCIISHLTYNCHYGRGSTTRLRHDCGS